MWFQPATQFRQVAVSDVSSVNKQFSIQIKLGIHVIQNTWWLAPSPPSTPPPFILTHLPCVNGSVSITINMTGQFVTASNINYEQNYIIHP